jgi:hypothetical protein
MTPLQATPYFFWGGGYNENEQKEIAHKIFEGLINKKKIGMWKNIEGRWFEITAPTEIIYALWDRNELKLKQEGEEK